jgi:cytochrome c-type biogenesis protein CcmH/NrfG
MTVIFIVILAALLFLYLALPLLLPGQSDPLPDLRDPVTQDLEEERDALLRAIRELDARDDLPAARRDALRGRYEAKTAKVLRALDERQEQVPPPTTPKRRPLLPLAALALLAVGLGGAAFMATNAVPEVVAADGATPGISGRELAGLERAAARDPSEANLLALADGYWRAQSGDRAEAVYQRVLNEITPVPAVAYERLGMLQLQTDVSAALRYLELARNADSQNLEVLYFLGEIYYANEDMAAAAEAWESYLAAPGGAGDTEVETRLALARTYAPLLEAVARNPGEKNLLALAESYWANQERGRAVDRYFQLLTEKNPNNATALSRVGQQLFFSGRNQDAIAVLGRARDVAPENLQTLLFLGNAHFTLGQYRKAIDVWQNYVQVAGGPQRAGRVPSLIADARERLRTGAPPPAAGPNTPADTAGTPAPISVP